MSLSLSFTSRDRKRIDGCPGVGKREFGEYEGDFYLLMECLGGMKIF